MRYTIRKLVFLTAFLFSVLAANVSNAISIPPGMDGRGYGVLDDPIMEWAGGIEYKHPYKGYYVHYLFAYPHFTEADALRAAEQIFYSHNPMLFVPWPSQGWYALNDCYMYYPQSLYGIFPLWLVEKWTSSLNIKFIAVQYQCPYFTCDYFEEITTPHIPTPDIPEPDYPDPVPEPDTPEIQYLPIYGYNMTTNETITYPASIAVGWGNSARGSSSFSAGACAHADERCSFVWSGVEGSWSNPSNYYSHGEGTFNIDPKDGIDGLYIGETNLTYHIATRAESVRDAASPSVTFYTNTGDTSENIELQAPDSTRRRRICIAEESTGGYKFTLPDGQWLGKDDYSSGITVVSGVLAKIELTWLSGGIYKVDVDTNLVTTSISPSP